jgi:hypothetical protein
MTPPTVRASISLRCPSCNARLRAARSLVGQTCPCPRCRTRVIVRLPLPSDADVNLVWHQAESGR